MKNKFLHVLLIFVLLQPAQLRADLFGADVGVLTQILLQAVLQLAKLREILGIANQNFEFLQDINKGINDSLNLLRTIDPNLDPGIYKDWDSHNMALAHLNDIYGAAGNSPDKRVQRDADQGVAEAITFSNSLYTYAAQLDSLSEDIKSASHKVSPGGAQKLTAQSLGLIIQVLNQNLRAQAVAMKVAGISLANENRRQKRESEQFLDANQALKMAMKSEVRFQVPRF